MGAAYDVAVIGAGSWGTALAKLIAENGHNTVLWARDAAKIREMRQTRVNSRYLPDCMLPESLALTAELGPALNADLPILAIPSSGFRALLTDQAAALKKRGRLAWATKGLEADSRLLLDEIARQLLGPGVALAVISGPNFAGEVARRVPSGTTVASRDAVLAAQVAGVLHNDWFRAYTTDDVTGVQVGGALKNALAIASGISDGLGFGANTRAALLTRGLAEMIRLAVALGARLETFTGLAGIGDLLLTCTDDQSRNRRFGRLLARGYTPDRARAEIGQVVEGEKTAAAACALAAGHGVELPIIEQVCRILFHQTPPREAVQALLSREPKTE